MNDDIWIIFIALFICAGSIVGIKWVNVTFIENIPSVVKVDGKVVYEGKSAGFDIESSGANTTITIRGGFLYFFPKAYYTSNKVEVIGKKS